MLPNNIKLIEAYNNLIEASKAELRNEFLKKFEYASRDTFYRKLNGVVVLKKLEREFFCEKMGISEKKLFPAYKAAV